MLGILLIDKPAGITSHDVVNRVRRKFGTRRVGHAGTLDPQATGLLVVAVGPATRFLQYLPLEPKEYVAQITFGKETTTQDGEGDIVAEKSVPADLLPRIQEAVPQLSGLIRQLPPIYSAIKKDGKPLYAYARKGEDVEREPRTVHIHDVHIIGSTENTLEVGIVCSGGTYIRTWAHDLGQILGCGAYLSGLERTRVGRFDIDDSVSLEEASPADLLPLRKALSPPHPIVELNAVQAQAIRQGQMVGMGMRSALEGHVAVADSEGFVFGMARAQGNVLQPECVIPIEAAC